MKDKTKLFLSRLTSSIKNSRKIQVGLAILLAFILILCYFMFIRAPSSEKKTNAGLESGLSEADEYARSLENKLEGVLCSVKGAGEVDVVVTLASGFEYVYATEETIKETSSGSTKTTSIILVSGKPVLVKQIYPKIKGVLVSSSGADDISVKVNLITAIQTVVEVANEDINILTRT